MGSDGEQAGGEQGTPEAKEVTPEGKNLKWDECNAAIQRLRDALTERLDEIMPSARFPTLGPEQEHNIKESAYMTFWALATLGVDVALLMGVGKDRVIEAIAGHLVEYAEEAAPVRVAERLTRHMKPAES